MMQTKWNTLATLLLGCALLPVANAKSSPTHNKPTPVEQGKHAADKIDMNKVSYGIGVDMGRNFKRLGLDIDLDVLARGLKDAYSGKKLGVPDNELRNVMSAYQNELKAKRPTQSK